MHIKVFTTVSVVLILLFSSFTSYAAKITGIVTDEKNEPLAGAIVVLKEAQKGAQTDVDGRFEINGVEDGTYELVVSMVTFKKTLRTVTISKGKDVEVAVILKEEGKNLTEVTVKTNKITNTENAVLMEIRKSNTIVSGISSQQIQKTMDRNAADVVRRVPGVTINDDRFIMVRGLNDRYNNVWLNDAAAPSSEVDKKSFSFDVIPSGQIDRIMVYKTPAPELPGDFAGGMVKLYTSSIPDRNTYTAGLSVSSRQYSTGTNFNYNEPSKTDWLGFDDGKRSLPQGLPSENIKKSNPDIANITKSFSNEGWIIKQKTLSPDMRFNASASNVFNIKSLRIGNTFAVNYSNTSTNFTVDRYDWDSTTFMNLYRDTLSVNNRSVALLENLAVGWGNNKIEFKNLYNQVGRAAVTVRNNLNNETDTINEYPNERNYIMEYESRAIYSSQLIGTHKSRDDNRKYTWAMGFTNLFKNQPDLRRIRYVKAKEDEDSSYSAPVPAGTPDINNGGGRIFARLNENVYSFSHQYSLQNLRVGNYKFEVSAGNYIEYKQRSYSMRQFGYTLRTAGNPNAGRLKRLPINQIFAEENLGGQNQFRIEEATNDYDKYDASNMLIAGFIALKLPVGNRVSVYGGARYEYNDYKLTASLNQVAQTPQIITKYLLPSVNASYNITDKSLVRVAYGMTLNRPEFRENSPFYFYDMENRWGVKGAMFPSIVNPKGDTLDVAEIHNIDARWEWYPSTGEMIQAGVFYKDIKNPIQQVISVPTGDAREYTFANYKSGYTYGVEFDVRKNLDFADKWLNANFFKNFNFVGNAAFMKSEVVPIETAQTDVTPLQGQSPYMYNGGLYYQNDSLSLQATLVYNVYGPRIFVLGQTKNQTGNVWELPFHSLDLVVSKRFFKHYTFTFGVQNLLNSYTRQFQDTNFDNKVKNHDNIMDASVNDRPINVFRMGRYYTMGIKVRF